MPSTIVCCAECHEPAYDRAVRDDAPWAAHPVDGIVCSPTCLMRARLAEHPGELDGRERAGVVRDAILEGACTPSVRPSVELVSLEVLYRGERCDFHGSFVGTVVDADPDAVTLEGEPFGEVSIPWQWVTDAREVS